jgi:MinD superfamily P-loop ATPase
LKIAVASGKGGTGKTTLATNLAHFLGHSYRITLADLDVEEPNSRLFLTGEPVNEKEVVKMVPEWVAEKCLLCGDCQKRCNFNAVIQLNTIILVFPELCHSCYACSELCPVSALPMKPQKIGTLEHVKNKILDVIEGRLDIGQEQVVPLISQTKGFVNSLNPTPDFTIYDAPPGTSCPVIEATKAVDLVILVTEPTPFGLHDLKLAVETMRKIERDFAVVINREGTGNDHVVRYCEKEHIPVIAKIPNRRKIAELYSRGELIYPQVPEFKQQLQKIKQYIMLFSQGGIK